MAYQIVNINEPPKQHPLQTNELPDSMKGAYEMKKIQNGYYLRVDMPGVDPTKLRVIKDNDTKEIRFQGYAKKDEEIEHSNRFYVVVVKVEECQHFDKVVVQHQIINGTCRALITGVDNASLYFCSPTKTSGEGSSSSSSSKAAENENPTAMSSPPHSVRIDKGSSSQSQPEAAENKKPYHHPYSVLIEGVIPHGRYCVCGCNGFGYDINDTQGAWSEEGGRIYGYVHPEEMGVFEAKFKAVGNGTDDYMMYFRMDVPDCGALERGGKKRRIDKNHCYATNEQMLFVACNCDLSDVDDIYEQYSGGRHVRRAYGCRIRLECDEKCCSFCVDEFGDNYCTCGNGEFRIVFRIRKSNLYKEDPSEGGERMLADNPHSDPDPKQATPLTYYPPWI